MEFKVKIGSLGNQACDCLVLPLFKKSKKETKILLSKIGEQIDALTEGYLSSLINQGDISANLGSSQLVYLPLNNPLKTTRILLVGCGQNPVKKPDFSQFCLEMAKALKATKAQKVQFALEGIELQEGDLPWQIRTLVEKFLYTCYQFDEFKSEKSKLESSLSFKQGTFVFVEKVPEKALKQSINEGLAFAKGISVARTLGNLPSNCCTPSYLTSQAKALAKSCDKLKTQALSEKQMQELGMGAFLSVAKGSTEAGQLIVMNYQGGKKQQAPYVLVGKGITFDSGGISLKPGAAMDEMKFDMCGAASVFGVMNALVELDLPINVVALVAAAENMPAGNASKPGDIVTSMSGQTIEILNTDAEGRLVLCDTLTYAERFKPAAVIDIATLTGACIVALGHKVSAMLSNNDELAKSLFEAGQSTQDKVWQMPLYEEYQPQLDSNFADMANIGGPAAGTITAACFLSRYTESYPWAHLDIAGTAWESGAKKGATGRPVSLLLQYLLDQASG